MGIIESKEDVVNFNRPWVSGFFSSFRNVSWPALYGPNKTPVTADVLEAGFIYAICILLFSFLIILPGIRGSQRWFVLARVVLSIFIGGVIILANFGQEWEVSEVSTKTAYRSGLKGEIHAEIGVKIGLRSVNITLKGEPENQHNETINYNERFHWNDEGWQQGRFGFGPFSGEIQREFRAAQYRGLPYPILWIAEYFTLDGEGIRWGRHYRQAGYATHIMLWLAFGLWLLSNILFFMVLRYGGYFLMMTGACMVIGNILYSTIRNVNELIIPWEEEVMEFHYGWCFWFCLFVGILCIALGLVVMFMDLRFESALYKFFGRDQITDYEEFYVSPNEIGAGKGLTKKGRTSQYVGSGDQDANQDNGQSYENLENGQQDDVYENPADGEAHRKMVEAPSIPQFRKRTTTFGRFQKKTRKPQPAPRLHAAQHASSSYGSTGDTATSSSKLYQQQSIDEDDEDYENVTASGQIRYQPSGAAEDKHVKLSLET